MKSRLSTALAPVMSGLFVAAFFLFAALWVNGNFAIIVAVSIATALGVATYLAVSNSARLRGR